MIDETTIEKPDGPPPRLQAVAINVQLDHKVTVVLTLGTIPGPPAIVKSYGPYDTLEAAFADIIAHKDKLKELYERD